MRKRKLTAEWRADLLDEAVYHWILYGELQDLMDRLRCEDDSSDADYIEEHEADIVSIAVEVQEMVKEKIRAIVESEGDGAEEEV